MEDSTSVEPIWRDIVSGRIQIEFDRFAARILHSTLARKFAQDPTPACLEKCATDLRELFLRNAELPASQNDLKKILG